MNALNDPQGRGRSASSPEFRKHAGMVVRSDRGDKKHREGFFFGCGVYAVTSTKAELS